MAMETEEEPLNSRLIVEIAVPCRQSQFWEFICKLGPYIWKLQMNFREEYDTQEICPPIWWDCEKCNFKSRIYPFPQREREE